MQSAVLVQRAKADGNRSCHFADFLERFPKWARDHFAAAMPTESMTLAQRRRQFQELRRWIRTMAPMLFHPLAVSECCVHGGRFLLRQNNITSKLIYEIRLC